MPKSSKSKKDRPRLGRAIGNRVTYTIYRGVEGIVSLLPIGVCFGVGLIAGRISHFFLVGYRKLARRNLTIAFGDEMSPKEIRALCRKHFGLLGANMICSFKVGLMSEKKALKYFDVSDHSKLEKLLFLIPHMGNWEILPRTTEIAPNTKKRGTLYQPLTNPHLDALVRRRRESNGAHLFDRRDGFFAPIKFLSDGGLLGILIDQHAGDKGMWCPFFGRLASTTNLAGLIARRAKVPMVPIGILTTGWARWKLVTGPELELGKNIDETTAHMNIAVEKIIRQSPADWFWVHNRWKTPNPAFLLSSYKRGLVLPPGTTKEDLKPFRMLVRSPNWLGDACMAVPAVRALKHGRPDARVTVLTPAKLADLWHAIPEVDSVIERVGKESPFKVARKIKTHGFFDAAILLPNSLRSALEAWLAGIPRRIGYAGHRRRKLLNQIIPEPPSDGPPPHHVEHYNALVTRIGGDLSVIENEPLVRARGLDSAKRLRLGLCAGAEYGPAKRWFPERFAEVAKEIRKLCPESEWTLFGGPGDKKIGEEISGLLDGDCRNLSGKTTLRELIDELHQCTALLTNDTGTMHLAAAIGVPTISIFGSTEPAWTGPAGEGHRILRHHVECSPCFLRECPLDLRCMKAIEVPEVVEAVMDVVGRGQSDAPRQSEAVSA